MELEGPGGTRHLAYGPSGWNHTRSRTRFGDEGDGVRRSNTKMVSNVRLVLGTLISTRDGSLLSLSTSGTPTVPLLLRYNSRVPNSEEPLWTSPLLL